MADLLDIAGDLAGVTSNLRQISIPNEPKATERDAETYQNISLDEVGEPSTLIRKIALRALDMNFPRT